MASKQIGRKAKRLGYFAGEKLNSLTQNQLEHLQELATADATDRLIVVSAWAAKRVFKEYASNPKMEEYLIAVLSTLQSVGEGKVSTNALAADIEALCKIKYDDKDGIWYNMKCKE